MAKTEAPDKLEYRVKRGDTLTSILQAFYSTGPRDADWQLRLAQVMALNPHIKHPDMIRAGSLLHLSAGPAGAAAVPVPAPMALPNTAAAWQATAPSTLPYTPSRVLPATPVWAPQQPSGFFVSAVPEADEPDYWSLAWLASQRDLALNPGSAMFGAGEALLSGGNIDLIRDISTHYAEYKANRITKGQYDYLRRTALDRLRSNIGPMERLLFGDKTPHQVVRIARGGGLPATANIERQAARLQQLAKLGKNGGYVLAGVGVVGACVEIAHTQSQEEKNRILVDTVGSTTAGAIAGGALTLFLVSNPVGWGTALVLASGVVAAGYLGGKGLRWAYDAQGNKIDLVGGSGIDRVCSTR